MKIRIGILTTLLAAILIPAALQAEMRIRVENVTESSGYLMVAIFKKDGFLNEDRAWKKLKVPAKNGAVITFPDLESGVYAVSLYQDLNSNGKLDKSFFGSPEEPFGFSRDAKPNMGPPDFSEASFQFEKGSDREEVIHLQKVN